MSSQPVDCMPQGLLDRAGLNNCPTARTLLFSLAAYNFGGFVCALIIGHDAVRKRIPSCSSSHRWSAWSGITNFLIHIAAIVGASFSIRSNTFKPNFLMMFGFWAMRPRFALATPICHLFSKCFSKSYRNPYLWSFKDTVVSETLLNIIAGGFSIMYLMNKPSATDNDDVGAGICNDATPYKFFWNCFYAIGGAGGLSCIILGCMIVHAYSNRDANKAASYAKLHNNINVPLGPYGGYDGSPRPESFHGEKDVGGFWGTILFIATINMIVTFAAQWTIWETFIRDAVPDFCPGSFVGQGISVGTSIVLNSFIRPIIGGSPYR